MCIRDRDEDCDGTVDDNAADASTWYADGDADGYGTVSLTQMSCTQPSGYVADATDCDDAHSNVHPGATEFCNGVDEDCDGSVAVSYTHLTLPSSDLVYISV